MRGKLVLELKLLVRVRVWVMVEFGTSSAISGDGLGFRLGFWVMVFE